MKWSKVPQRPNPAPHEKMDAHSSPITDVELDEMIDWVWSCATATWEHPANDEEVRVVNKSWFRKWKALTELKRLRCK
jgi:hypothetical protein